MIFFYFFSFFFYFLFCFFFSSRRRHTRSLCDWSSEVLFRSPQIDADQPHGMSAAQGPHWSRAIWYAPTTYPLNNFRPFFTLFSKCFPSFLHSTCSLSVSRQYLALDEVYHPFWPAFPSKPTLWQALTTRIHRVKDGALTLSGTQFQERIYTRVCTRCCL